MNFFHRAFASRSKTTGKSWYRQWAPVPFLVFGVIFFGYRAANQNDAASKQQTSFATISQCEHRGRGNENYCHYSFQVGDDWYRGISQAASETELGQTVVVYYDSQNPRINALEDFAEQSRKSMQFFYVSLIVFAAVVAFILWDRAPYRETSDEPAP